MFVSIETIKHQEQRYDTSGDWFWLKIKSLRIIVSDLNDDKMNACIAVHELIEALLCRFSIPEVTQEEVDKFDMNIWPTMEPQGLTEPGDSPQAPYHLQHMFASGVEKAFAEKIGVNWEEYEKRIKEL